MSGEQKPLFDIDISASELRLRSLGHQMTSELAGKQDARKILARDGLLFAGKVAALEAGGSVQMLGVELSSQDVTAIKSLNSTGNSQALSADTNFTKQRLF